MKFLALALVVAGLFTLGTTYYKKTDTMPTAATTTVITVPTYTVGTTTTVTTNASPVATPSAKQVKKVVLPGSRTVYLLGEVGNNGVSISRSITKLSNESDEPIFLVIDSPGGSVIRGALIISAIESSKAPVYTVCYNICASMAAQIHAHGYKRYAVDRAVLMYHWATAGIQGDVNRMVSFSEFVKKYVDRMDAYIIARSGMDANTFNALVASDMWRDAEDAKSLNLVDDIVFLTTENDGVFGDDVEEKMKYFEKLKPEIRNQFLWPVQ